MAERDKQEQERILLEYQRQDWQRDKARAEAALEELAADLERRGELREADEHTLPDREIDKRNGKRFGFKEAAALAREKAAELKGGGS